MKKNNIITPIAIVSAIVLGIILAAAIISTNSNSLLQKYRTEAVRVLEKYKDFDIDAKEAAQRIGDIRDAVYKEKSETKDDEEMLDLWLDLVNIHTKLYHYGSATGYEIDEAIKEIKGGK